MCNNVTTLNVRIPENRRRNCGAAAFDALCECLRAWASSLECISLTVRVDCQYPRLFTELSALSRLEELHISCEDMAVEFYERNNTYGTPQDAAVDDRYRVSEDDLDVLSSYLENSDKFPALRRFAAWFTNETRLSKACHKRGIHLYNKEGDFKLLHSHFLPDWQV